MRDRRWLGTSVNMWHAMACWSKGGAQLVSAGGSCLSRGGGSRLERQSMACWLLDEGWLALHSKGSLHCSFVDSPSTSTSFPGSSVWLEGYLPIFYFIFIFFFLNVLNEVLPKGKLKADTNLSTRTAAQSALKKGFNEEWIWRCFGLWCFLTNHLKTQ